MRKRKFELNDFTSRKFVLSAVIAIVVITIICIVNVSLGSMSKTLSYGADSRTAFRPYGNETLMYTKDGVSYYNSSWETKWTDAYSMAAPIMEERGEYTAIYETGGRSIRLYNKEGLISGIQTTDTIVRVSVAENGYVSVITNGSSYMVSVYNSIGSLIFQRVESDSGIYPICCDVSPDGEIIAISYMDTTGVIIETKIGLFYIDADAGSGYTDSMFSAVKKEDEIIFEIFFTSNKNLTAIGDRHIITLSSAGTETSCTDVENEILGVGICGNKIALVYGDELPNKEGKPLGTVAFVSSMGKISVGNAIDAEPDYFYCSNKGIVLGSAGNYYGINTAGNIKWELYSGDVNGIYPSSSINKCVYATRTWVVTADMNKFDISDYKDINSNSENKENTEEIKSQVETVAEPIENKNQNEDNTENKSGNENASNTNGEDNTDLGVSENTKTNDENKENETSASE